MTSISEVLNSLAPPPGPRYTHLKSQGWHPSHPASSHQHTHLEPMSNWGHAFDITENPECYLIITDCPGLDPEDIHIRIDPKNHEHLIIQGDRPKLPALLPDPASPIGSPTPKDVEVWRAERARLRFYRTFILPINADADHIAAFIDKGVLTVRVPKLKDDDVPQDLGRKVKVAEGIWKP
jgi:HSP20 family molecular chaperone IbpA